MPTSPNRQILIRARPGEKSASFEGFTRLSFGDQVKVVVANVPGADASSLSFYIFSKTSPFSALISPATDFAAVPERSGEFESATDAVIATAALSAELATLVPGTATVARLYVADVNVVWVDCDIEILPSPHESTTSWPDATGPFAEADAVILKEDLATGLAPILVLPTATAAQREARVEALLALLNALSA